MIPSRKWFPSALQERSAWFDNFETQFRIVGPLLGFTATDVKNVTSDSNLMQMVTEIAVQLNAYTEAVRQFRIIVTEGNIGDPTPTFPSFPGYGTPGGVPTGVFERLDNLVKRIRVAPGYIDETGAILGIFGATPARSMDSSSMDSSSMSM